MFLYTYFSDIRKLTNIFNCFQVCFIKPCFFSYYLKPVFLFVKYLNTFCDTVLTNLIWQGVLHNSGTKFGNPPAQVPSARALRISQVDLPSSKVSWGGVFVNPSLASPRDPGPVFTTVFRAPTLQDFSGSTKIAARPDRPRTPPGRPGSPRTPSNRQRTPQDPQDPSRTTPEPPRPSHNH